MSSSKWPRRRAAWLSAPLVAALVFSPAGIAVAAPEPPADTQTQELTTPTTEPLEAIDTSGLTFDLTMNGQAIVTMQEETILGPGVTLTEFERLEPRGWQQGAILDVDLANDAVSLDYLYSGEVTQTATVTEMAESAENIAGAINGDFFDINGSGAPNGIGVDPEEGIVKTPQWGSSNALILDSNNLAQITDVWTEGNVWIKQDPAMAANDIGIRIDGVNVPGIPTNDVAVYTSAWGDERRLPWEVDRVDGIEVWVDETSTVTKIQLPGEGAIPENTRIIAARPGGWAYEQLSKVAVGDTIQIGYTLRSNAMDAQVGISGGANLVVDGVAVESGDRSVHPRTAVGINEPGTRLILALVDGRSANSRGMDLTELGAFMAQLGSHNAINFDGGGSSTMIARGPGDPSTDVVNTPSDGTERRTANGLGVAVAPGSQSLDAFDVETADGARASTQIFPGLSRQLIAQGMDDHLVAVPGEAEWSTSDASVATVDADGVVTGVAPGTVTITASNGDATGTIDIVVRDSLVRVVPSRIQIGLLSPGAVLPIALTGFDANGFGAPIDVNDIAIDVDSTFTFTPDGASRLLASSDQESGSALATLTVGGIDTKIPMTVGTESILITDLSDAADWTFAQARASGTIEATTDDEGQNAIRLTHDFASSTGTRGSYAIAPNGGIVVPGQPMAITMKMKGDGTGAWPRLQMKDGDGVTIQVNASDPGYIDFEGWQTVTYDIPAGTPYPLTLQRVRIMETDPTEQYQGDVTFSQIEAIVAPDVTFPDVEVYRDPAVSAAGAPDDAPLRIAVVSDAQFVASNPTSANVTAAREVLREVVADQPDRILILGDWVDEGKPEDIAFARQIIDEELGDTGIEWTYAPGNHEAMSAPGMEPWHAEFGPGYGVEDVNGTRLIHLDSHPYNVSHNPEQLAFLRAQLDDALTNDDITGVVLGLHHPTQDNVTGASALNDSQDSRLIETWMAEVYAAGKSALVLNAGVGAFDVYQVDGVVHATNGNSGKSPNSTPDRGGFSGWTMVGIDPAEGLWQESDGQWLTLEINPFVSELTIDGPAEVAAGSSIALTGTVNENGRMVPAAWPVSFAWGSDSHRLFAGDPTTAPEIAVATIDPATGMISALDRVVVDDVVIPMSENLELTGETVSYVVTATLLVNDVTQTYTVAVNVPVATPIEETTEPTPDPEPEPQVCEVMDRGVPSRATDLLGEATGDRYADLWAVNDAGEMYFYEGSSTGSFYGRGIVMCDQDQITSISKISDQNRDNRADLLVRHTDGNVYYYYSTGNGFLRQGVQAGHNWNGMDNIVYAGTLGAGNTEYVVARQVETGHLYRYTLSESGLHSGVQIGHGWTSFHTAVIPGDVNGDGRADLVGMRDDGKLFFYANTGRGYFAPAHQAGHGWSKMAVIG